MSTKIVFYIFNGFGLSKGEWGSNENAIIFNAIKVFQAKLFAIKRKHLPVMLVLSESFHVFESRIACRCNRFPSRRRRRAALSIWHQLTQSIQKGESSFQEKCMDFHEIHPRVAYDLAHVCISWSEHITLCVDIISFLLEFSFKFIWIFQNINNKRFQDFSLK
jgi:hypothetical protein